MQGKIILFILLVLSWMSGCIAADQAKRKVEMMCGGYKWTIACGRNNTPKDLDPRECNKNTVTVTAPNGMASQIKDPPVTKIVPGERWDERRPSMFDRYCSRFYAMCAG